MNSRVVAGSLASLVYARLLSGFPSRRMRRAYLRAYLGRHGEGTSVQVGCRFLNGPRVFLGDRTIINFGCLLDGRTYDIRIGDDVSIGPEAAILTLGHDPASVDFADTGGAVTIGAKAWIAFRALVLPGVSIGEGAVVAAGAIVSRDVPPFAIVAGNPARIVGERPRDLRYRLSHAPWLG